jgi:hypothetical protein
VFRQLVGIRTDRADARAFAEDTGVFVDPVLAAESSGDRLDLLSAVTAHCAHEGCRDRKTGAVRAPLLRTAPMATQASRLEFPVLPSVVRNVARCGCLPVMLHAEDGQELEVGPDCLSAALTAKSQQSGYRYGYCV